MKDKSFASLEKAIDIIDLFYPDDPAFTVKEISNRLNLPLSTTYKYIDVLIKRGLLARRSGSRQIAMGPVILRLGGVNPAGFDLINVALPHMRSLMEQSGETVLLTAIEGWNAICLERMEPQRLIKLNAERGRKLPLHVGASSRVLLAFQNDRFISEYVMRQDLIRVADNTITEPDKLIAELKLTRERGYTISDSEVDADAKGIAAPILGRNGSLIGGITIAGPSERIDTYEPSTLIDYVCASAKKISKDIEYRQWDNPET